MATGRRRVSQVRHRAEDLDKWAPTLYRRYSGPIAVALELSKGPIVSVLQKYDFFVLYLIDPSTLAYRRKTFTPSGAKDDPTDAECALKLLLTNPLAERLSCASNLLGDRLHRRPSRRMR